MNQPTPNRTQSNARTGYLLVLAGMIVGAWITYTVMNLLG